jgi:hypothetical protein
MFKIEVVFSYITLALVASIISMGNMVANGSNGEDNGDCYNSGVTDGQDHPFNQNKYDECGSAYYEGFLSGCMSAGNDREMCVSATD